MRFARLPLPAILALTLCAVSFVAAAQPPVGKIYRIGILYVTSGFDPNADPTQLALMEALRERGYVVGQNLVIEVRSADGKRERLPELAMELVKIPVDLILVPGASQARVAKQATATIPIVFGALAADPLRAGLVESLARSGGNVTGTTAAGTLGKRLELLKETVSKLVRVAVLVNPGWPLDLRQRFRDQMQTDAARLALQLQFAPVQFLGEFPGAFAAMTRKRAQALLVPNGFSDAAWVPVITDLALRHRLPAMYDERQFAMAGGLMTYAPNFQAIWRRTAHYVDRILQGARPADLPVEQPTTFEFVINLKTARALGLTIPPSALARADEVIE